MVISVIIPVYNCQNQIEKCLNSIVNQTYKDLEIIIVNDGSIDNSLEICKEFEQIDKRIKVINNSNHGVSYSRNCGMKYATGDYITFVDSDDYLEVDCYENMVKYFEKKYDFIRYNLNDIPNRNFNYLYELSNKEIDVNTDIYALLQHFLTSKENIPCFSWLLLIKKEIAQKVSFNENLTVMEDTEFYISLLNNSKTAIFLDLKKYNYYINPNSVMHNSVYYEKNIFAILDSNYAITEKLNFIECSNDINKIICEMKTFHLGKICNYIFNSYYNNRKKCNEIINNIRDYEKFKSMICYSNKLDSKNKILIYLIKKQSKILLNIYLKTVKLLSKLKR